MKLLNIVIFGPPGAGKGTQAENLVEKYKLVHLSTGNIFRSAIKSGTELGNLAKSYIDKGELVPDEVTIKMLELEFRKNKSANGFIFDGFPRTVAQAIALDDLLRDNGTSITMVIGLSTNKDELIKRLLNRGKDSGRTDDQDEDIINNRIAEYKNKTAPLIEYFKNQKKFKSVQGIGSIEEIFVKLCGKIEKSKN